VQANGASRFTEGKIKMAPKDRNETKFALIAEGAEASYESVRTQQHRKYFGGGRASARAHPIP
jgi:hypothetical protein